MNEGTICTRTNRQVRTVILWDNGADRDTFWLALARIRGAREGDAAMMRLGGLAAALRGAVVGEVGEEGGSR